MSLPSKILAAAPVRYYRLQDALGSTSVLDSSTNASNGTVVGSLTFGATGVLAGSKCCQFGGSGHITLPSPLGIDDADPRTIHFLVYRRQTTREIVFAHGNGNSGGSDWRKNFYVYMNIVAPGDLYLAFNGCDRFTAGGVIPQNEWCQVTVSYAGGNIDGTSVKIRINGTLVGTSYGGVDNGVARTLDNNAKIGEAAEDPSNPRLLRSDLQELAIFNREITQLESDDFYAEFLNGLSTIAAGSLRVFNRTTTGVTFNYDSIVGGSTPYSNQLQRSTTSGSGFSNVGSAQVGNSVQFTDSGLTPLSTYYYRVVTTDSSSASATSAEYPIYIGTASQNAHLLANPAASFHYGIYAGFGIYTPTGNEDPDVFQPGATLDIDQWLDSAQAMGCKSAMFTTMHHDGFCLYPSLVQPHGIAAGSWYQADPANRDLVKLFTDKTRARGMRVELYFSIRDKRYETDNPSRTWTTYTNKILAQLTELLGGAYGSIQTILFDGWGWDVGHGNVPISTVFNHCKTLQPGIVCIENDHAHTLATSDICEYEKPIDVVGGNPYGVPANNALPAEFWTPIRWTPDGNGVFWTDTPDASITMTGAQLADYTNVLGGRNAVFRINPTPGAAGVVPADQVTQMRLAGGLTTPPPVQRMRVVRTSSTSATLQWQNDAVRLGDRYYIYRSTSETTGFTKIAERFVYENAHLGFVDSGLTPGTTYYYRIALRDVADNISEHAVNAPYYPAVSKVQAGENYGPTGTEFTGSLAGGSNGGGNIIAGLI